MAEKTIRKMDRLAIEMKQIRWGYMSTKSELMYNSKQTEVAKAVESLGLKELIAPPKKIHLKE